MQYHFCRESKYRRNALRKFELWKENGGSLGSGKLYPEHNAGKYIWLHERYFNGGADGIGCSGDGLFLF